MTPETGPVVDGITSSAPLVEPEKPLVEDTGESQAKVVSRMKFVVLLFLGLPYLLYIFWCLFLLSVLPDATGQWDVLIPFGKLSAMIVGIGFLSVGGLGVLRAGKNSGLPDNVRYMSFVRLGLFLFPGLILSAMVPMSISGEPALSVIMTSPPPGTELVAPVSITLSAENAVAILERRGLKPVSFDWDFNGDAVSDQQTVVPSATALFERQGTNSASVTIALSNGTERKITTRISVPYAVFSYTPLEPIVDEPVRFSVAHLIPPDLATDVTVKDVQWDFDGDEKVDLADTNLQATHTFLRTGPQDVSVTIVFSNQTQLNFLRTIMVGNPAPLPFPVKIETTPEFLESPPPFQVVFRVVTDEPIQDVVWDFGDGSKDVGERIGHTFRERGTFQVVAEVRNQSGQIAKLSKNVKTVNSLRIPDLSFDGSHTVIADRITARAPVAIELTPKTSMPLVNFFWEVPNASEVASTDTTLKAVYRNEGNYNIILIGQDAEGSVLRRPIILEVQSSADTVNFDMKPTQGVAPLTVKFDATDTYIPGEEITGFVWTFGDSEQTTQLLESGRVEHVFSQAGTYTVTLTVYTTSGLTKSTSKTIVVRAPILDACFVMSRTSGPAPLGVSFDRSCTTGFATKVLWDFGDESQSNETENTVNHVFQTPGKTYTIRLRLEDENGMVSTVTKEVTTE